MIYSDKEYPDHFFEFVLNELKCVGIDPDGFPGDQYSPPGPSSYTIDDIMQYTGVKDRNGKEIYEHDIVRRCSGYEGDTFEEACSCLIQWDDGGFCLAKRGMAFIATLDSAEAFNRELKIIGNIHENPELLENTCPVEQRTRV